MGSMADPPDPRLCAQVVIPADPVTVRDGLKALFDTILLRSLPEDGRGTAEIVLAEALNNIVEHAYARQSGDIEITLDLRGQDLVCRILDSGLPMPKDGLPEGRLVTLAETATLPEGGFGWFLIRTLSRDLDYRREGGRNLLSFRLDTHQMMN
jgi:serine/threonine-protein kinase RsbW